MIEANILADSRHPVNRSRITTFELTYPRFIHCFHPETEFLSQVVNEFPKFRSFDAIRALGAKVAQYDNGEISFVEGIPIEKYHEGSMIQHRRRIFEFCVTPEHRMYSLRRTTGDQFLPHTDLAKDWVGDYQAQRRIPQAGNLSTRQEVIPEEAQLIAFFVADGTISWNQVVFHFRKNRKAEFVLRLLSALSIEYKLVCYDEDILIKFDKPWWADDCYSETGKKRYPDFLWNLDCWDAFKEATIKSDGSGDKWISSTSKEVAEQTQVLALLNNTAMNVRQYGGGLYKQSYQRTNYVSFRADKDQVEEVPYQGNVVCFSVPSSYLCVRYKGFAFVSGNCELMTHRKFSRNSASSRAIPTPVLLKQIEENPVIPEHWGKLQKGMQAYEELSPACAYTCKRLWLEARDSAVETIKQLYALKLHKQIANRLLEPWMWITVIVTSDDRGLQNFFRLRVDPMAEPHIQKLACMMFNEYRNSQPVMLSVGDWHIPFVSEEERQQHPIEDCIKKSVARCARGSYLQQHGNFSFEDDLALGDKLSKSGHWSPFEHQAMCTQQFNMGGNFCDGWLQNRKRFIGEHGCEENFEALEELILKQHKGLINSYD